MKIIFRRQLSVTEAGLLAPVLIVISMLMATPIFFHTQLKSLEDFGIQNPYTFDVAFCLEEWEEDSVPQNSTDFDQVDENIGWQRIYYSIFSMAMQYVIPFVIMASIYLKIFYYLKTYRMVRAEKPEDKQRARRTNVMLCTISMVFCVAWLPLNLIGIILDANKDFFGEHAEEITLLTYISCHLVRIKSSMSSKSLKSSKSSKSSKFSYLVVSFRMSRRPSLAAL